VSKIDKFTKWFIASFILGIVGLIAVFFVEEFARVTGEFNRSILFFSTITVFILILISLFSIVKANSNRIRISYFSIFRHNSFNSISNKWINIYCLFCREV